MTVLLTRKAVLQAAVEATYNVAATVGVNDGQLVSNPAFTITPKVLERTYVHADLSPQPILIGQKIAKMTFETELRGNGLQNSGLVANAPILTRLLNACGYALTGNPSGSALGPYPVGQVLNPVTWDVSSGATAAGVWTAGSEPTDGQTVIVGNSTYTFKTTLTPTAGQVLIGGSATQATLNLIAAVNLAAGAGTNYAAATAAQADGIVSSTGGSGIMDVVAPNTGSYYNSLPLAGTAGSWGHTTLQGGTNIGTNTDAVQYTLSVVAGGASGTATIAVTSDTTGEALAAAAVTSGTAFTVGTKGLTLTPTWIGNLTAGNQWVVWLMPSGIAAMPISDNLPSITLVLHKDGVMHTMAGSYGTFEVTAQAGSYATVKWTFTGTYAAPVDDPNPLPIFETELPSQVQLARLNLNLFNAIVEKFTFNQMNDVQIRPDVSSSDGYNGVRIVSRKPEGGINPEADLVSNNDFWGNMAASLQMPFEMRCGAAIGNTVWFFAPNTQYSGLTYGDRSGILVYDAGLRFGRANGNDENFFYFM